jgi:transcriptional regulator with XRE-family HTH domain
MAKKFDNLRKKMTPERQARAAARTKAILEGMALADLRRARELSQETLAAAMQVSQPEISKLEKRADTYVSTLRKYIEALGGSLEIVAHFREGDVRITQFAELEDAHA